MSISIRPQYHLRRTNTGIDAWKVNRLITMAASLPTFKINPSHIAELDKNHWYFQGGVMPTPRSIMEHAKLINEADLSYAIILDAHGRVMDGMHRICKAVMIGTSEIDAVQFHVDPPPDYKNCDPATLPYDHE